MSKMRTILKSLMDKAGDTPYDIHEKTGIQPSTTYRFLTGNHGDPKSSTVRKWAALYGVTESQLRGDAPIDGLDVAPVSRELSDLLTLEECNHVSNLKNIKEPARGILLRLAEILVEEPQEKRGEISPVAESRKTAITNNPLRASEDLYKAPPKKKRLKGSYDGRKYSRPKSSQIA